MAARDTVAWVAGPARARVVATQTLAEALRLRLTALAAATGGALVLLAGELRGFQLGTMEPRFLADFGLGAIGAVGTVLATFGLAHLCFRDLEGGGAGLVLTRRISRGEFLAGKLAGVAALLALMMAALATLLAVLLAWRGGWGGADAITLVSFLHACALGWLKLTLAAAMTLLVCSYAGSALFAGSVGLMLTIVAHLRGIVPPAGGWAWLRVWPDFTLFDVDPVLAGRATGLGGLLELGAYWLLFLLLFTGAAAYVFGRREF